jgi:hypothetical protein
MSSLLASVLLLIALMLGAVLLFDLWRSYRIRRARQATTDTSKPQGRAVAKANAGESRAASGAHLPVDPEPLPAQFAGLASEGWAASDQVGRTDTRSTAHTGANVSGALADASLPAPVAEPGAHADLSKAHAPTVSPESSDARRQSRDEPALGESILPSSGALPNGRAEPSLGSLFERESVNPVHAKPNPVQSGADPGQSRPTPAQTPPVAVEVKETSPGRARERTEPLADLGSGRAAQRAGAHGKAAPATLSERTDCVLVLRSPQALEADRVMLLVQDFRRVGAKPVLIEACSSVIEQPVAPRVSTGGHPDPKDTLSPVEPPWQGLVPGQQYRALRMGVLMANRAGPLNAMEFSDFVTRVRQLSERLGCRVVAPDMAGVLSRARVLDAECMRLDAQVGLNVLTEQALSPAQLAGLAAPLAISERGNNRYARLTGQGQIVFSVALSDQPNRLSLLLDVPRVPESLRPWSAMADCARIAAQHLDGKLVDDTGRDLSERAVDQIGLQLAHRYRELDAAGLTAGSAAALRVFN